MIRSIVTEVCPGELLLVEMPQASLPEWTSAAVTAARNDLDRHVVERKPIDAGEYLRLAIVEHVMGPLRGGRRPPQGGAAAKRPVRACP